MSKHKKDTKAKGKKKAEVKVVNEAEAVVAKAAKKAGKKHLAHLAKVAEADRIVHDKKASKKDRKAAARFLVSARKSAAGDIAPEAASADAPEPRNPDTIDRNDEAAVADYNANEGKASGHFLTSAAELAKAGAKLTPEGAANEADAEIKARVAARKAARIEAENREVTTSETVEPAKGKGKKAKVVIQHDEAGHVVESELPIVTQVAEVVETETGREFSVGEAEAPALMPIEDDPNPDFQFNGNGQYKVYDLTKKAERGYTRATTYIDCLEDKKLLTQWKMREVLIGAGLDYAAITNEGGSGDVDDTLLAKATRLYVDWAKAYRKAAKRDAKGELDLGQFALLHDNADKVLRDGVNLLSELAMEFAGANEKREHGTDLHRLTERLDRGEFTLSDEDTAHLVETGQATHADVADLVAYRAKMEELGIEHFLIEQRVVIDRLKVAGTLDRGSFYKPKGAARRIRVVGDLKTGRVDFSAGKIGMQLGLYAEGEGYDLNAPTGRTKLGLSRSKALLIHLPAGEAQCTVYEVDLVLAAKGLKLAADVRAWRNEGKHVYDAKAPLTAEAGA